MARKKAKPALPATAPRAGADLADQALGPRADHKAIAEQIEGLSPEEARLFAEIVDLSLRKRRWLLFGYLGALLAVLVGMVVALWVYGTYGRDRFVGWAFVFPPAAGGLILWLVGRHVRKMK
ncbi:MAG TPA: hypothetical protein VL172_00055 [Kofleriaceae bacterium]|jgi:hypothetical protein|nr:hypothetical protein [Kofleriaceae bacterium]